MGSMIDKTVQEPQRAKKMHASISILNRQNRQQVDTGRLRRDVKRLLAELNLGNVEISVLLVDDDQIQEINRIYLKRNRPTNVISFSMTEGPFAHIHPEILGDIIISADAAERDARSGHIDFMDEMAFLLIHGLLHLIGYEHEDTSTVEQERMKLREKELFFFLRQYDLE